MPARLGDELLGAPTRLVRNGSARRGVPSSALAAVGAGSGARAGRSACGVSPTPGRSSSRSCVLYACAQAFWGAKHAPAGDFGRRFAMASKVYHANSTQQHQQRAERRARTCARVRACAGGYGAQCLSRLHPVFFASFSYTPSPPCQSPTERVLALLNPRTRQPYTRAPCALNPKLCVHAP